MESKRTLLSQPVGSAKAEQIYPVVTDGKSLFRAKNYGFVPDSYTSTELNDVSDLVNTSERKVAGFTIFNSTTGHLVTAAGPDANDVWVDGSGNTINTPV